ncbi:MAG: lysophospholipid acyltransferase family protein [Actinomycetaceae bacterium]|nr:1-acyl-sn-glycerol-3-phosphate acyltransferase [Arcanobacterium sp.]MDD7504885.1 lysophospholipid acyltransferase family protein [Actinomycetaceae bacterium]MDY6142721.1 lysophospholipid acyltransferase family protein [Arcanobacterium sp.]
MATPQDSLHPLDSYHSESKANARKVVRAAITRPVIKAAVKTHVDGLEHAEGLPETYIVVANHTSHLDTPMIFSLLPESITRRLATGAAADYFYRQQGISKLTSLFFNTYPVERKGKQNGPNAGKAAGMTGRLLRDGVPILIFPEGTRSRDGQLGTFKPGAAALSIKLGIPIVPVALHGGHEAMPVGKVLPKFGHLPVELYLGEAMYAKDGESPEDFMARIEARIRAMLDQKTANPT